MPTRLQISPRYCWWAFVGERSKPVPRRGVRSVPPTNEVVNQEAETELRGKPPQPLSETLTTESNTTRSSPTSFPSPYGPPASFLLASEIIIGWQQTKGIYSIPSIFQGWVRFVQCRAVRRGRPAWFRARRCREDGCVSRRRAQLASTRSAVPSRAGGLGKKYRATLRRHFQLGNAIDDCRGKMLFAAEQCPSLFELHTQFYSALNPRSIS